MSYVKYGVPSHDPQGLQTGSRLFSVLQEAAPIAVLVAIQGFSNQGLVNHQVPVQAVETPPSRTVFRLPTAAGPTEHFGVSDVALTVTFDTAGTYTPLAKLVRAPREPIQPYVEREQTSRFYKPIASHTGAADLPLTVDFFTDGTANQTSKKVHRALEPFEYTLAEPVSRVFAPLVGAINGEVDLPLTVTFDTAGTATSSAKPKVVKGLDPVEPYVEREQTSRFYRPIAQHTGAADLPLILDFNTEGAIFVPSKKVHRALEPHSYELSEPVSRVFAPLVGAINGEVDVPLTVTFDTAGTSSTPGGRTPGVIAGSGSNFSLTTKAAEQFEWPNTDLLSRGFVYYNAAPPIYRVIVPGSTNQFYTTVKVPVEVPVYGPSKLVKGYASPTLFGEVTSPFTFTFDTQGFATKRGVSDVPLTFTFDTAGTKTTFGVSDVPLTLTFTVDGTNVTRGISVATCDTATLSTVVCGSDTLGTVTSAAATLATITDAAATLAVQSDDSATLTPCD